MNAGHLRNGLLCGCLLACTLKTAAQQQEGLQGHYHETYTRGIVMWFEDVYIHIPNTGEYLFSLALGAAHPLYTTHQQFYGRLTLNQTTGHYEYVAKDSARKCAFEVVRDGKRLNVKPLNRSCTFSAMVLESLNPSNPDSFAYRDGKISFSTPPDSFRFEYKSRDLVGGDD